MIGMNKKIDKEACRIIDALGGTSETARMFNIEPPSVTGWKINGIPEARLMYLRLARPDLFPVDQEKVA